MPSGSHSHQRQTHEGSPLPACQAWVGITAGRPMSDFRKCSPKKVVGKDSLRISLTNIISRLRDDLSHTTQGRRRRQN